VLLKLFFSRIVCQADASAVSSFEEALFPVFQGILQQDIVEFMPYVFQMLSVLLEVREGSGSIPEPYWALFPCLLSPALWDRTGNVTPLIRLISAFIKQGSAQIQALGKLVSKLVERYHRKKFTHSQIHLLHYRVESLGSSRR